MITTPETVPQEYDAQYLTQALERLHQLVGLATDLESATIPDKPRVGMVRYFDGSRADPGSGEGLYVYLSTGWTKAT